LKRARVSFLEILALLFVTTTVTSDAE